MSTDKFDRVSAIAQHAANECERLRAINTELISALQRLLNAADRSNCNSGPCDSARALLAEIAKAESKS